MIIDSVVDEMYEGHFDGELIVEVIQVLQQMVDKHGEKSSLSVAYDCDGMLRFNVTAPREETQFETQMRELQELQYEEGERKQLAYLKEKYGDK